MAKIRIVGDSSGYVELSAPNAAGNNTLELPSNATKLVGADASNSLNVTGIATFSSGIVGNVTGNVNATGLSTFTSGINVGTGASISSPATNVLTLGTNNVERIRVGAGGSVNIGATDTSYKLQVTGAPQNTSNFGILHIRDSQTLSGAAGTGGIFLSSSPGTDYYIAKGYNGSNTKLKFGNGNNGNEYMGIDDSGRVTMPYQPYARASSTTTQGATNAIPLNSNASYNYSRGGITISGNRFTVPVAGAYVIGYHHLGNSGSGACQIEIRHNGSYIPGTRTQDTNSSNDSFGTQTIKELNASDYIEFWVIQGASHGNQDYNSMWIWLLG